MCREGVICRYVVGAYPGGWISASMMELSLEVCANWAEKNESRPETDCLHVSMEF